MPVTKNQGENPEPVAVPWVAVPAAGLMLPTLSELFAQSSLFLTARMYGSVSRAKPGYRGFSPEDAMESTDNIAGIDAHRKMMAGGESLL